MFVFLIEIWKNVCVSKRVWINKTCSCLKPILESKTISRYSRSLCHWAGSVSGSRSLCIWAGSVIGRLRVLAAFWRKMRPIARDLLYATRCGNESTFRMRADHLGRPICGCTAFARWKIAKKECASAGNRTHDFLQMRALC